MLKFKYGIDKNEHDSFVLSSEKATLMQSSGWTQIKNNWDSEIIGVYRDGKLVASSLALIRRLPLRQSIIYLSRGPVMDYGDRELVEFFFKNAAKWAIKENAVFIKCDPPVIRSTGKKDETPEINQEASIYTQIFEDAGLIYSGLTEEMHETIQPRFHMVVAEDGYSEDNFTKKGRKNLRKARKQNLRTSIEGIEALDRFSNVMSLTEERKGVALRDKEYYRRLLETYGDDAFLTMTYIDVEKSFYEAEKEYFSCKEKLEACPDSAPKKKFKLEETFASREREYQNLKEFYGKYGKETCVCGTLTVIYGDMAEVLYAGMNDDFRRQMGPYEAWTQTFEECFKRGVKYVNMGGVENTLDDGLAKFKFAFNPVVMEFIGEFDLPVKKLAYGPAMKLYKRMKMGN